MNRNIGRERKRESGSTVGKHAHELRRFGGYIRDYYNYYHPLRNFNAMVSYGLISLKIIILVYHHFPWCNSRFLGR